MARAAWRRLQLSLAFVGAQLRRLPGSGLADRFSTLIVVVLVGAALVSLSIWAAQRSPQRISMADLTAGALSPMQTWIIVSGDLEALQSNPGHYVYILTDPAAPRSLMYVTSQVELPLGAATVSGTLIGGAGRAHGEFGWAGQLRADPVLAREQDPPWISIALVTCAVLLGLLARTSYPIFFNEEPRPVGLPPRRIGVTVRREWSPAAPGTPGVLDISPGQRVRLAVSGGDSKDLRLHSARSSVEVGRFHRLSGSEPVLLVRASGDDLALSFASADDRDGAYAALAASAALPRRPEHPA